MVKQHHDDNRLQELFTLQGQSPWLDNLRRDWLTNGELQSWVNRGIRGVTSNPSIFQKAIEGSDDYDQQFFALMADGLSVEDAYWELVTTDINGALDALQELYVTSHGKDGFVSVEVDPSLAHDTNATSAAALDLSNKINRPNLMVKIPGTEAGLPAIQKMIGLGKSVNVTLIFSVNRYQNVVEAYISGLEDAVANGATSLENISSVASFFVSRTDTEIDARLSAINSPDSLSLRGYAAVSQAKVAYSKFQAAFSGPRWEKLASLGANVQRPLWASTSVKNPSYSPTLYVDELIGPDSVNTMPDNTIKDFLKVGSVARTVDVSVEDAQYNLDRIQTMGIDLDDVAQKLEIEGVASFTKAFHDLLTSLEAKAKDQ
jgi:transaldolase|tara:strand:- start:791 stop:1912 length:1122 start_codon:yes stop_codon:yes gene_type:complete